MPASSKRTSATYTEKPVGNIRSEWSSLSFSMRFPINSGVDDSETETSSASPNHPSTPAQYYTGMAGIIFPPYGQLTEYSTSA